MFLVETHIISKTHPYFKEIDFLAYLSKNLWNTALYHIKQHYKSTGNHIFYKDLQRILQNNKNTNYYDLPAKVSQQILIQLDKSYKSFFKAMKVKEQLASIPLPPRYKDKKYGRNKLTYTIQSISSDALEYGIVHLSQTNIYIETKQTNIKEVRIVKRSNCYKIEVIYEKSITDLLLNKANTASIDLGINNLAVITFSNGMTPLIINGKPLKSINQYYNKQLATAKYFLKGNRKISNRINRLSFKRNNKVKDYLHKSSRYIINYLVSNDIGKLIIGYNPYWKQEVNIGRRNNQNFVNIPHRQFIDMLTYKAALVGIEVIETTEEYTSKCSFLDLEPICKQENYAGKRVKRGLFMAGNGQLINADVNGSYNIMRKVAPDLFSKGVEAFVVKPFKVAVSW
jgi:putative transposase